MATKNQVYAKFGVTAEVAQLFETELGTLILAARGLDQRWHIDGGSDFRRRFVLIPKIGVRRD